MQVDGTETLRRPSTEHAPAHAPGDVTGSAAAGLTLCLVQLMDGTTLRLYATAASTSSDLVSDGLCVDVDARLSGAVCAVLQTHEEYYFGLQFVDKHVGRAGTRAGGQRGRASWSGSSPTSRSCSTKCRAPGPLPSTSTCACIRWT